MRSIVAHTCMMEFCYFLLPWLATLVSAGFSRLFQLVSAGYSVQAESFWAVERSGAFKSCPAKIATSTT